MGRKIILSRKGFDDTYGGMASAFVRGGEMVSFPIPHTSSCPEKPESCYPDSELVGYDDICVEGMSLQNRLRMLKGARGDAFVGKLDRCHNDPDLRRGVFGQSGSSQGHLRTRVGEGDLFLFFGRFQESEWVGKELRFCDSMEVHALFGFLEIGNEEKVLSAQDAVQKHPHLRDHPHLTRARLEWDKTPYAKKHHYYNTVYIAAESLSLPGVQGRRPGYGVFRHSPELVLTASKEEQMRVLGVDKKKVSHTVWNLDKCGKGRIFRGKEITYHTKTKKKPNRNPWLSDCGLFQSAKHPGQEFVVYDDDGEVSEWAAELIQKHCPRS